MKTHWLSPSGVERAPSQSMLDVPVSNIKLGTGRVIINDGNNFVEIGIYQER